MKINSLVFIESYVKENKHLPEITSADEMKEDRVNVENFKSNSYKRLKNSRFI